MTFFCKEARTEPREWKLKLRFYNFCRRDRQQEKATLPSLHFTTVQLTPVHTQLLSLSLSCHCTRDHPDNRQFWHLSHSSSRRRKTKEKCILCREGSIMLPHSRCFLEGATQICKTFNLDQDLCWVCVWIRLCIESSPTHSSSRLGPHVSVSIAAHPVISRWLCRSASYLFKYSRVSCWYNCNH